MEQVYSVSESSLNTFRGRSVTVPDLWIRGWDFSRVARVGVLDGHDPGPRRNVGSGEVSVSTHRSKVGVVRAGRSRPPVHLHSKLRPASRPVPRVGERTSDSSTVPRDHRRGWVYRGYPTTTSRRLRPSYGRGERRKGSSGDGWVTIRTLSVVGRGTHDDGRKTGDPEGEGADRKSPGSETSGEGAKGNTPDRRLRGHQTDGVTRDHT